MINKSIAYRLSVYISIAVITVFITFIIISYFFYQNLLKENTENKAIGLSSEIIMEVEKLVVSTREITSNISEQILYYSQNDDADLFLKGILKKYSHLNAIHVNIDSEIPNLTFHNYLCAKDKNDSIFFEEKNLTFYHCETEKYLTELVIQKNAPGWTEPFRCTENNTVVVSYYCPISIKINETETIVGEVICELSLLELNNIVNSKKIENNGFAFLISQKGDYITHPKKEWILTRNIYSLSDSIYDKEKIDVNNIISSKLSGTTISHSELLGYEKSWVYYAPIKENGWFIIFTLSYDALFEPLYKAMLRMLFFSVIGILVIFLIVTFITNKLVEPLSTVTTQLKKFSNLSGKEIEGETMNEVTLVSESLDYLQNWYENYLTNQTREKNKSTKHLQDLHQASEIQHSLIKTNYPAFPNRKEIDLYAVYNPANIVSGDLFDYFFIDDEHLIFTIGDVSGKGIPAAIFMSISQTIIKANTTSVKTARNMVNKSNLELYTKNQHQFFLTLFLGILNVKSGALNYCNAAHTATILLKSNGEIVELGQSHGLPLGLYPDKNYTDSKIKIEKGDSLILYTDGITELQDNNQNHFGMKHFKETIKMYSNYSPKAMADKILKSLEEFGGGARQVDDISLLIIKYNSKIKA